MSTTTLGFRRDGWVRPVALPEHLEHLRRPVGGSVRLPLRAYSSGAGPERVFDLDNEAERIELCQIVLADGTVEDICGYLNHTALIRRWTRLWLPADVRRAGEPLPGFAAS